MNEKQPKLCLTDLIDQDLSSFELFQSLSPKIKQEIEKRDPTDFSEMQSIVNLFKGNERRKIMQKFENLNELLKNDSVANSYFNDLPEYVKEAMFERGDNINSFESMCNYVDNYTEGDD